MLKKRIFFRKTLDIPTLKFNSDYFKCPACGYAELRKILGDVSYTPCPDCGHSPMYRV